MSDQEHTTQRPADVDAERAIDCVERISAATRELTARTVALAVAQREADLARMAYSVAVTTANAHASASAFPDGWRSLLKPGGRYWTGTRVEQPQLEVARVGLLLHLDEHHPQKDR